MTILELRRKVQEPRRAYDTFYSRHVMRRFSIYFTFLFSKTNLSPTTVTFLSLIPGLIAPVRISQGHILEGLIWVHGWYLLDHVDGELARLKSGGSVTGLFFDTIANAIVMPLVFWSLGLTLARIEGQPLLSGVGLAAAYGFLMMLLIPCCETDALMESFRRTGVVLKKIEPGISLPAKSSLVKRFFSRMHLYTTFPVFLPLATTAALAAKLGASLFWLEAVLISYAICVTLVWPLVLAKTIRSRKTDKKFSEWVA